MDERPFFFSAKAVDMRCPLGVVSVVARVLSAAEMGNHTRKMFFSEQEDGELLHLHDEIDAYVQMITIRAAKMKLALKSVGMPLSAPFQTCKRSDLE